MQTLNRSISIALATILVAAFFMPLMRVFGNISAWDMIFGDVSRLIDTDAKYIAVVIPAAGVLIFIGAVFNNEDYLIPQRILFLLPILTLISLAIAIGINLEENSRGEGDFDFEEFVKLFGIGFWLTFIASFILPFLGKNTSVLNRNQPDQIGSTNRDSLQEKKQFNYSLPKINLPKFDWEDGIETIKVFILKYKKAIWGILIALVLYIAIYNLFIKDSPVSDGKRVGGKYCACLEMLSVKNSSAQKSFLDNFAKKNYRFRSEARTALGNQIKSNELEYNACVEKVKDEYSEKENYYHEKSKKNYNKLTNAYNSAIRNCNSINSDSAALQGNIDERIKSIIDPRPDIEKIKSDLIGQDILGWKFEYISEIRNASIIDSTFSVDRAEYKIDLRLIGYAKPESDYHNAEIIVAYQQYDEGWMLASADAIFLSYINEAPVGTWQRVEPLPNSTYVISNDRKFWVKDGDYGQTYKGGPDGESFNLKSTYIYISSRENVPIKLTFTYRPSR
jgi:hypothetical protein